MTPMLRARDVGELLRCDESTVRRLPWMAP
jgi:hypothetical protein